MERWVEAVNTWLRLSDVHPSHYLDYARGYFHTSGSASAWLQQRDEEVAHFDKEMTWEWLQHQLIQHFGQPTGVSASEAAWVALRMGEKNADGSETGGAATRTVKDYTARFCHYMRILTSHDVRTTEFLVITHYVEGIRLGYEALHRAMKGTQLVLRFDTLQEAIEAAQLAEVNIAINRNYRPPHNPSATAGGGGRFGHRGGRGGGPGAAAAPALNNLQGGTGEEGETEGVAAGQGKGGPAASAELYSFNYRPDTTRGRHQLTPAEAKMLYEAKRCYRCYKVHLFGVGHPRCEVVQKVAPQPLK